MKDVAETTIFPLAIAIVMFKLNRGLLEIEIQISNNNNNNKPVKDEAKPETSRLEDCFRIGVRKLFRGELLNFGRVALH